MSCNISPLIKTHIPSPKSQSDCREYQDDVIIPCGVIIINYIFAFTGESSNMSSFHDKDVFIASYSYRSSVYIVCAALFYWCSFK